MTPAPIAKYSVGDPALSLDQALRRHAVPFDKFHYYSFGGRGSTGSGILYLSDIHQILDVVSIDSNWTIEVYKTNPEYFSVFTSIFDREIRVTTFYPLKLDPQEMNNRTTLLKKATKHLAENQIIKSGRIIQHLIDLEQIQLLSPLDNPLYPVIKLLVEHFRKNYQRELRAYFLVSLVEGLYAELNEIGINHE